MGSIEDPHCPECGEPIGQTATYCMHCSADLSGRDPASFEEGSAASDDGSSWGASDETSDDGSSWGGAEESSGEEPRFGDSEDTLTSAQDQADTLDDSVSETTDSSDQLLDPDGIVDNTLTVIVGILGGIVVGLVGSLVFAALVGGLALIFGLVVWLGSTAYLVRRRTVQGAVAKSGYAVAVVLLSIPFVAFSPLMSADGGLEERAVLFFSLLLGVALPAAIAGGVGWVASQFVPDSAGSEG